MTQKELNYVEDAIMHETNIISIIEESIELLEDKTVITFMQKEHDNHNSLLKKLLKLMEEKANE